MPINRVLGHRFIGRKIYYEVVLFKRKRAVHTLQRAEFFLDQMPLYEYHRELRKEYREKHLNMRNPPKDTGKGQSYRVKRIIGRRYFPEGLKYLVEWRNRRGGKTRSWEPAENLAQCFWKLFLFRRKSYVAAGGVVPTVTNKSNIQVVNVECDESPYVADSIPQEFLKKETENEEKNATRPTTMFNCAVPVVPVVGDTVSAKTMVVDLEALPDSNEWDEINQAMTQALQVMNDSIPKGDQHARASNNFDQAQEHVNLALAMALQDATDSISGGDQPEIMITEGETADLLTVTRSGMEPISFAVKLDSRDYIETLDLASKIFAGLHIQSEGVGGTQIPEQAADVGESGSESVMEEVPQNYVMLSQASGLRQTSPERELADALNFSDLMTFVGSNISGENLLTDFDMSEFDLPDLTN